MENFIQYFERLEKVTVSEEFLEQIRYTGFDVSAIGELLMNICKKDPNWTKSISSLIILACERGTNWRSAVKDMSAEGSKAVTQLCERYQISERAVTNKSLTLSRLIAFFPHCAIEYCLASKNLNYSSAFIDEEYPKILCNPYFAAMIPIDLFEKLSKAYGPYSVKFTKMINTESRGKSYRDVYEKQLTYMSASSNSPCVSKQKKLNYLMAWGLVSVIDKRVDLTDMGYKAIEIHERMLLENN